MLATELMKAMPLAAAAAPRKAVGRCQKTGSAPEVPRDAIMNAMIVKGALIPTATPREEQPECADQHRRHKMPDALAGAVGTAREQQHPGNPGDLRHRQPETDRDVGQLERLQDQRQEKALAVEAA